MNEDIEVQTPDSELGWSIEMQVLVVKESTVQTEDSVMEYEDAQMMDSNAIAVQTEDNGMEYQETQVLDHTSDTQTKHCTNNTNGMKPKFPCEMCNKEFSNTSSRLKHMKKRHAEHYTAKKAAKGNAIRYSCTFCPKSFSRTRILWKHLEDLHNVCHIPKVKKDPICACNVCGKHFAYKSNLRKHTKKMHQLELPTINSICFKCSECQSTFKVKSCYFDHIITAHNISVDMETLQFENEADFDSWKKDVEKNTISCFRKSYQYNNKTALYVCHRSGFFVSKNTGKRRLKTGGSIKINSHCPASIYVRATSDGNPFPAEVKYISTHLGHECEIGKMRYNQKQSCHQVIDDMVSGFVNKLEEIASEDKDSEIDKAIAKLMALKTEPNTNPRPQNKPPKRRKKAANV